MGLVTNSLVTKSLVTNDTITSIVTTGLQLHLDASIAYTGSTTWTDVSGNARNFTLKKGQTTSSSTAIGPTYGLINKNYGMQFTPDGTYSDAVNDGQWLVGPTAALQAYTSGTIDCWLTIQTKTRTVDFRDSGVTTAHTITSRQRNGSYSYGIFSIGAYCDSAGQPQPGVPGRLYWHGANGVVQAVSTGTLIDNIVYHVAVTWSGTNCKFYINGALDSTTAGNYSIPADAGGLVPDYGPTIGVWPSSNYNLHQFSGVIYAVKMYNAQLSDAQVLQNYNALTYRFPKVVEFIKLRAGGTTGTTIADVTYAMLYSDPTPAQPGDLIIYIAVANQFGGAGQYWTPPAGWTELVDQGTPNPIASIGWRRLGTATQENALFSDLWTSAASAGLLLTTLAYRNAAIDAVGSFGAGASNTGTITIPSITTTASNTLLQGIVVSSNATAWSGSTTGGALANAATTFNSTVFGPSLGQSPATLVFGGTRATAGVTGTYTTNFSTATGGHAGILISLKPL